MAKPLSHLPDDLRRVVEGEIEEGERIIWLEQPLPSVFARVGLPFVLMGAIWTGFLVVWTVGAFSTSHDITFALLGVPGILFGLGFFAVPLWFARRARGTAYVVTDRRAIVLCGGSTTTVRAYTPKELGGYTKRERRGGSGDLIFGPEYELRDGNRKNMRNWQNGFFGVPDVQEAEKFVKALIAHGEVKT